MFLTKNERGQVEMPAPLTSTDKQSAVRIGTRQATTKELAHALRPRHDEEQVSVKLNSADVAVI